MKHVSLPSDMMHHRYIDATQFGLIRQSLLRIMALVGNSHNWLFLVRGLRVSAYLKIKKEIGFIAIQAVQAFISAIMRQTYVL
jgi:hypothetical protein